MRQTVTFDSRGKRRRERESEWAGNLPGRREKGMRVGRRRRCTHTDKYLPFIKANAERTNGEKKKEEERIGKKGTKELGKDIFLFAALPPSVRCATVEYG